MRERGKEKTLSIGSLSGIIQLGFQLERLSAIIQHMLAFHHYPVG